MKTFFLFNIIIILSLILLGCGDSERNSPVIFSMTADPEIVLIPGGTSTITLKADDPDSDVLFFTWTVSGGTIQGNGKIVTWIPPETEGKYDLSVTVSDGENSVSQTIKVRTWIPRPGDYYPLTVGNKWTFKDDKGNTIENEIIDTITIVNSNIEAFVKQIATSGLKDAVNFTYITKNEKGAYQYAMGGGNLSGDTIIFTPELPVYKFPLITETSWKINFDIKLPEGYVVGNGTAIYEVLSESNMTVPAGSFEHVFQVKEDFTWELLGREINNIVTYNWVAPDIGSIKFTQEEKVGGETIFTEAILQSYSLK